MAQRIKGQEVTLAFTDPDGDVEDFGVIKSFEGEIDIQTLEEGYLGETANQYDDIYNGVSGTCELHMSEVQWFRFSAKVQDRAARRTPAAGKFSVTASFAFPNGQRPRVTFENIFFGPLPFKTPSRADYVTVTLSWKCSEIRRVL